MLNLQAEKDFVLLMGEERINLNGPTLNERQLRLNYEEVVLPYCNTSASQLLFNADMKNGLLSEKCSINIT